jgi:hypothetical protein
MLALLAALLISGPAADPEFPRGLAKLAVVQGPIELSGAPQAPKVGDEVDAGATINTHAGSRATFDFPDGSELRINENTEVSIEGPRKIALKHGRIFIKIVKAGPPFEINTEHVPVSSSQSLVDIEFTPRVPNGAPAATFVRVLEGTAKASSKKFSTNLFAGFYATAVGSQLNTPDPLRNGPTDTAWIHPLLLERGRMDEEIGNRVMDLVQVLGRDETVEAALRSLGDLATPELVRFLIKSADGPLPARRISAVRIVSGSGTLKSAPALVSLLQHPEADIRVIAASGLARLAGGKDLGFNEQFWKGETRDAGQKAWEDWVKQNAK